MAKYLTSKSAVSWVNTVADLLSFVSRTQDNKLNDDLLFLALHLHLKSRDLDREQLKNKLSNV